MSFPNNKNKYNESSILKPELVFNSKLISPNKLAPETMILCYSDSLFDLIIRKIKNGKVKGFYGDLRLFRIKSDKFGILGKFGIGGPVTAVIIENLAHWGVKNIISLGLGSSLQDKIQIGDIIIVEKAIRDEGTSQHYEEASKFAYSTQEYLELISKILTKKKILYYSGPVWTTDAVYRETKTEVIELKKENILAVEMETATLYTVAKYCSLSSLSIIGVSDSIASLNWKYENKTEELNNKILEIVKILMEYLNNEPNS